VKGYGTLARLKGALSIYDVACTVSVRDRDFLLGGKGVEGVMGVLAGKGGGGGRGCEGGEQWKEARKKA
jgi:hypothetical protein